MGSHNTTLRERPAPPNNAFEPTPLSGEQDRADFESWSAPLLSRSIGAARLNAGRWAA